MAGAAVPFDFRRPSKFGREAIRRLEVAHEVFTRRLSSSWGAALRSLVQLEPLAVDQVSYDDYVRSMPNPSLLATVGLPPLPGAAVIEVGAQLALVLVDRLLGGSSPASTAKLSEVRRPTQLETFLLRDLMRHPVAALEETIAPIAEATAELQGVEYNPQLVQVAAPSDMVLLLSYRMTVTHGTRSEGLLTVCYPTATVTPVFDQLTAQSWPDPPGAAANARARQALGAQLDQVDVVLRVGLHDTAVPTRDLVALQAGDVLRLDHPVTEPVVARIEGTDALEGRLCRRHRRLALQLSRWALQLPDTNPPPDPTPERRTDT